MKTYPASEQQIAQNIKAFRYHPPKDGQPEKYTKIRQQTAYLASDLVTLCPPSRELSLALTNLEQAVFWANAAIARNETIEPE